MNIEQFEKLFKAKGNTFVVLDAPDFHRIFTGTPLTAIEREFKTEFWKAGGLLFNPKGSSKDDKLMTFCAERHLGFRWVKNRVVFYTGNFLPDEFLRGIENGRIPSLEVPQLKEPSSP